MVCVAGLLSNKDEEKGGAAIDDEMQAATCRHDFSVDVNGEG